MRHTLSLSLGLALFASLAIAGVPTIAHGQAPSPSTLPRPLRSTDLYRLRDVGAGRISPDGQWIAYTVVTVDSAKDRSDSDVWMVNWEGTRTIKMAGSPEGESNPRWSPDNRYLSFVSGRYESKGGQIWLLDRAGGEAVRLTELKGGVSEYEWSPDGTRIALVSHDPDPDDGKPDSLRSRTPKPIVIDRYAFKRDGDGYLDRRRDHIHVVHVATKQVVQITSGDFDDRQVRWSPDGTRLVFTSERTEGDPDRSNNSDLFVVDAVAGATPRTLTTWRGPDAGAVWSPDGTRIAYLQASEPELSAYTQNTIAVVSADGGAPRLLTTALDRDVSQLSWSADGTSLRFLVGDDRAQHLAQVDVGTGAVTRLADGRRVVTSYDVASSGRTVLNTGTAQRSAEVFAWANGALRALTHVNDSAFAALQLGTTEDVQFRNRDGLTVGALLTKPVGFDATKKYPLLLRIHGGPNGQDQHLFQFERELFAANGYVVLQVNYRGSSGRGQAWKKAIFADWGNKEVQDLLAGVDHVLSLGFVDPNRLGIGGWSYGGILTDYTIATTTRFKAATSGAGSALQTSMYGSDQYIFQYENELGAPWKNPKVWEKVSYPFYKADRIRTPTLFMGGERDFNVPIAGSEQMYQALKSLGVPTQLIVYPGQFHGISRPSFVRDRYDRYLAWYDKYLAVVTP
ncbi:MAG: S9 family peptidase [Gemmatimonas sp.]|jgi:dipeptidyl aminopeptidase/acylaminoacyl peptidase|uniref:S9 family peptidase n=1 Tax=Gemmatimonas sp. TaxID=1962908 RepID=UPI0022BFF781|nr:S9 family peptidase [Gemmatimonas sp.]MCE2954204.1 S9 family peptidase [Gemmatimonas sp.]MCZ8011598.1 S9 family peptidase [Gemmatimonas sp.]MCZ8267791.1 S9 family peptidase [Gemmatimonas sp.]